MSTIWQDNAGTFASTPESYVDAERHDAVRRTVQLLAAGQPGRALYTLVRSVERQARIAGAGTHTLQPSCPCGGRCPNGNAVTR